jgi:hypothetical protein
MQITEIVFRTPPAPNRQGRPSQVINFLKVIADRPNEWAVYREGMKRDQAHALASQNRRRHKGSEWTARQHEDGLYTVYAKVVSEG